MAAALIRGMAAYGNSATVKHFMANSQEYSRARVDAVMSERAAREIYLKGFEYAAARDHYGKFLINPNFINAGVILFNLKKCRETRLFEKCRELIKTKKLVFADESAIIRCTTKKKMLSQRFNDQKFLYKNTVIRHFSKRLFWTPYPHTANIKQWSVTKVHKIFGYENFDDILYEYIYQKNRFEREFNKN